MVYGKDTNVQHDQIKATNNNHGLWKEHLNSQYDQIKAINNRYDLWQGHMNGQHDQIKAINIFTTMVNGRDTWMANMTKLKPLTFLQPWSMEGTHEWPTWPN